MTLEVGHLLKQAHLRLLLDRLVGRPILPYPERIMTEDIFHRQLHKGSHSEGRLDIVAEHKECGARTDASAMKRDTIDKTCHGQLGNTGLKEGAAEIFTCKRMGLLQETIGLVAVGEVGTRDNHVADMFGQETEHRGRSVARSHIGLELDAVPVELGKAAGDIVAQGLVKLRILLRPLLLRGLALRNNLL